MITDQAVQWLDAYTPEYAMLTSVSSVNGWVDRSGNGRGGYPIYSGSPAPILYDFVERAVQFTSLRNSNDTGRTTGFLETSNSQTLYKNTPFTIFIVEKKLINYNRVPSGLGNGDVELYFYGHSGVVSDNQRLHLGYVNSTVVGFNQYANDFFYSANNLSNFVRRMWVFQNPDTLSSFMRLNGSTVATHSRNTKLIGTNTIQVGHANDRIYNGKIYEIIGFNNGLANSDVQYIEGTLAWKWGLQSSLPPTHPYASTNPNAQPVAPTRHKIYPFATSTTLTFYWNHPGTNAAYFELSLTGGPTTITYTTPGIARQYTFTGLTTGTYYTLTITASNNGVLSAPLVYARAQPCSRPSAPISANFSKQDDRVYVTWTAPPNGGGEILWYTLRNADRSDKVNRFTIEPWRTTYLSPPITPGQSYTFTLEAINTAGYGASASSQVLTF